MGYSIKIGNIEFSSKKEALIHFKRILNSYKIGEELIGTDLDDVLNLLNTNSYGQERINKSIKAKKCLNLKNSMQEDLNWKQLMELENFSHPLKVINFQLLQ